jgi:hypothetical protein
MITELQTQTNERIEELKLEIQNLKLRLGFFSSDQKFKKIKNKKSFDDFIENMKVDGRRENLVIKFIRIIIYKILILYVCFRFFSLNNCQTQQTAKI